MAGQCMDLVQPRFLRTSLKNLNDGGEKWWSTSVTRDVAKVQEQVVLTLQIEIVIRPLHWKRLFISVHRKITTT